MKNIAFLLLASLFFVPELYSQDRATTEHTGSFKTYRADQKEPVRDTELHSFKSPVPGGGHSLLIKPEVNKQEMKENIVLREIITEQESQGEASGEQRISGIRIYPNPTNDQVYISLPSGWNKGKVNIYDITGRVLATKPLNTSGNRIRISLRDFSPGVYYFGISDHQDVQLVNKKIVKY